MSKPFSLNSADFAKGVVVVVIVAVLGGLQQMLISHGLDFANYDFALIANLALTAGVGYLSKNFLQDSDGKVMGRVG